MTLLLGDAEIDRRREAVRGSLRPLADSLAAELRPYLEREPWVPEEKARLTRAGGRCPDDGTLLEFDPDSPRAHRCPRCERVFRDEAHYRSWIYWYQLWLAERAVHASALHLLRGEPGAARFADRVLDAYTERYLYYPNRDNVLGPTRPFFSTYLESIWLLQLAVALDLRERAGDMSAPRSAAVRERVLAPSAELIGSYDEGRSNRQVWNSAALLATALVLGDKKAATSAVHGRSGVVSLLDEALLADGTWYEGDNYHQFAHRGLWYGVTLAEHAGIEIPEHLRARFDAGFAVPFVAALPDFTFPSRRDSQYAVSLRQWRFAEMAELGLARGDDERLVGALFTLYDDVAGVPRRDTGRATSAAEAERNALPSALSRADLGWRSLLFAREVLPPLRPSPPRSVLFEAQGLAVLRRDEGRLYAALDYGQSGGGHGHPDRLNVILVRGDARWLDDPGTGSYVDRSLHWYRSTLAHNAPLVDARSQQRTDGLLRAFEDRGGAGWVDAEAEIAPGVSARRAVVVFADYLLDDLTWSANAETTLDLPLHVDGVLEGDSLAWAPATVDGGPGVEDGFDFLAGVERLEGARDLARLDARVDAGGASLDVASSPAAAWWRAVAPGPPGSPPRRLHWLRQRGTSGRITTVWSWGGAVASARAVGEALVIEHADGSRHEHRRVGDAWQVLLWAGGASSSIELAGRRPPASSAAPAASVASTDAPGSPRARLPHFRALPALADRPPAGALVETLGESHYRRSEESWRDAGAPIAELALYTAGDAFVCEVRVPRSHMLFVPPGAENEMDNEHPEVNGDGVQLHAALDDERTAGWRIVPGVDGGPVRVTAIAGLEPAAKSPSAEWRPLDSGYLVRCVLPLAGIGRAAGAGGAPAIRVDVVVNETAPGRERRRGQLVLSGGAGEWVYLRGDRQPAERLVTYVMTDVSDTVPA